MVERLHRLRHHAVVGSDDQHDDVGHPGAARTHRRERLVPRGVDERDLAVPCVRLVGTDVLRDAPELTRDHVGGADRVEELRLPVVDVAHDGHDRRAGNRCALLRLLVFLLLELELVLDPDDVRRVVELIRDHADRVIGQRRRGGSHLAGHEQDLHDLGGRAVQLLRDHLGRGTVHDLQDGAGRGGGLRRLLRLALARRRARRSRRLHGSRCRFGRRDRREGLGRRRTLGLRPARLRRRLQDLA